MLSQILTLHVSKSKNKIEKGQKEERTIKIIYLFIIIIFLMNENDQRLIGRSVTTFDKFMIYDYPPPLVGHNRVIKVGPSRSDTYNYILHDII